MEEHTFEKLMIKRKIIIVGLPWCVIDEGEFAEIIPFVKGVDGALAMYHHVHGSSHNDVPRPSLVSLVEHCRQERHLYFNLINKWIHTEMKKYKKCFCWQVLHFSDKESLENILYMIADILELLLQTFCYFDLFYFISIYGISPWKWRGSLWSCSMLRSENIKVRAQLLYRHRKMMAESI